MDEFNDFVEDCQNSDFGMVPLVVPVDMVILVIQVNLVNGEYDIPWDSGYFMNLLILVNLIILVKLLILILENLMMVVNLMIPKNLVILVSLMIICKSW